jgi:putative mycofactocin binding protein MftB
VSTEDSPANGTFDLDSAWRLDERVSIRPERFGALLYHFGTRRLSFLKSPVLLQVVRGLAEAPSAREACARAGVSSAELPRFRAALAALASSRMIARRGDGVAHPGI